MSFAEGACLVANLGGDADTCAAIYGTLAGAYYGEDALPAAWLETLMFKPLLIAAGDAMWALNEAARRAAGMVAEAGSASGEGGAVAEAAAAEEEAAAAEEEAHAAALPLECDDFGRLLTVQRVFEARYTRLLAKLSPGPGPPMKWPGGYRSVGAFEAAAEEIVEEAHTRAAELGREVAEARAAWLVEQVSALTSDWQRQWAEDARQLRASFDRAPAVGAMLAQIGKRRPHLSDDAANKSTGLAVAASPSADAAASSEATELLKQQTSGARSLQWVLSTMQQSSPEEYMKEEHWAWCA